MFMIFDDNTILGAAHVFEQARGRRLERSELEDIRAANLEGRDAGELAEQLVDFIRTHANLNSEIRGAAYWALGKRCDAQLLPFFREALSLEIDLDTRVAYQIMIALDNLGESIFEPNRTSSSYDDEELNHRDAMAYLKKT